jgi:glycosyltransferase involved in cell wall biosynthesis
MSDCDFFESALQKPKITGDQEAKFSVAYTGAVGQVNQLEYLLDAALACQNARIPANFLVAGEGALLQQIHQKAKKMSLANIEFLGHLDKKKVRDVLRRSDAVYISFKNIPVLETNSPNKFFDGLAAGKICITNTRGWVKDIIESAECGFYADPDHPAQFAEKIMALLNDPATASSYKANARKLAKAQFSRSKITTEVIRVISPQTISNKLNRESAYSLTH